MAASNPGALELQNLRDQGIPEQEVQAYKADATKRMLGASAKPSEIDAYWGDLPRQSPHLDNTVAHNSRLNRGNEADVQVAKTPLDYLAAGWDISVTGLVTNQRLPKTIPAQDAGFMNNMLMMLGQTAGDAPASVVGFLGGAFAGGSAGAAVPGAGETGTSEVAGGVLGAGVGSAALPEGMRQVLVDHYRNGDFLSFEDFMHRSAKMSWETGKAGLVGGISVFVGGKAGGRILNLTGNAVAAKAAELTGFAASATVTHSALNGRVPNAEDFVASATMVLGFHVAGSTVAGGRYILSPKGAKVANRMQDVYARTGVPPWEQAQRAKEDPSYRQEIFGQDVNGDVVAPQFHAQKPHEPDPYHKPSEGGMAEDGIVKALTGLENSKAAAAAYNRRNPGANMTADRIVSSAGAIGKFQIMPDTARQYMGKNFDVNTLFDPAVNEKVGRKIIADLTRRYRLPNGEPDLEAIYIAYNAGPGRANAFRANGRNYHKLPVETQRYLERADRNGWLEPQVGKGGGGGGEEPPGGGRAGPTDPDRLPAVLKSEEVAALDRETLQQRILDLVGKPDKPSLLSQGVGLAEHSYTRYVTELGPAKMLDEAMEMDPKQVNVQDMFRSTYASGERAGHFLRSGAFDPYTFKRLSDESYIGAYELAQKSGGTQEGFTAYRLAKRTVQLAERGIRTGINPAEAAQFVAKARAQYEAADQMVNRVKNGTLDYAESAGLYGREQIAAMKEQNRSHIPLERIMDTESQPVRSGRKRGFQSRQSLRRMTGSERQIVEPVYADIENIHTLIRNADRNIAIGFLVDPFNRSRAGAEITPVQEHIVNYLPEGTTVQQARLMSPTIQERATTTALAELGITKAKDQPDIVDAEFEDLIAPDPEARLAVARKLEGRIGPNDFIYYRDGNPEVWTADHPLVAKMIKGATPADMGTLTGVARWFAMVQRSGITTLPDYIAKMVIRDQFTTPIVSKFGGIPFQNLMFGAMEVIGQTERYHEFVRSGGMGAALADMDVRYISRDVEKVFAKTDVLSQVANSVGNPIEAARLVMERVDAMSRLGMYSRQLKAGENPLKSAMRSRKAYLDFAERGTSEILNWWAGVTPFLRPTVLGFDQLGTALKTDPFGVALKGAGYITVPTVGLWIMNYLADQGLPDGQKYGDQDRWLRDNFWITPPIGGEGGVRVRFPKPRELGMVFGSLPERMLEKWAHDDPRAFKDWAKNFIGLFYPNMMPTIVAPITENIANFSWFKGQPLVPSSVEDASNYMQYTPNTTETSKALARAIGPAGLNAVDVSPMVLENYTRQWAGTAGTDVLRILDVPAKMTQPNHAPFQLADMPFVSSFVLRHDSLSAAPIQDFYDELKKLTKAHKDLQLAIERDDPNELDTSLENIDSFAKLQEQSSALAKMRQALQGINDAEDMTPNEKRQYTDDIFSGMIQIAKSGVTMMDEIHKSSKEADSVAP